MGTEVNLLEKYPKIARNIQKRCDNKTEEDRILARKFGQEFFDGDRKHGYGGYHYHPRFWQPVIPTFQHFYHLDQESTLLDVGCAKGYMLHDFQLFIPGITVHGIDISSYAIHHAHPQTKPFLQVADARTLPFPDHSFDLVISINTIHNFEGNDLIQSLREIERVKRKNSFIVVDAYRNEEEKQLLHQWNLTAKSILHVDEWISLFEKVGYTGDYYWFLP